MDADYERILKAAEQDRQSLLDRAARAGLALDDLHGALMRVWERLLELEKRVAALEGARITR